MADLHTEFTAAVKRSGRGFTTISTIVERQFKGNNTDLARALGVAPRTVQRWRAFEEGRPGGRDPGRPIRRAGPSRLDDARALSRTRAATNRLRQEGATVSGEGDVTVSADTTRRRFRLHIPARAFRRMGPALTTGRLDELGSRLDPEGRLAQPSDASAIERAAWSAYKVPRARFADEDNYPSSIDDFGFSFGSGTADGETTIRI